MKRYEAENIVDSLTSGKKLTESQKKELIEVLVSNKLTENTKESATESLYSNEINELSKQIKDVEDEITKIVSNRDKLNAKEQKQLTQQLITLENLKERRREYNTLSNKQIEVETTINKEFEIQDRKLDKQIELKQLQIKSIREGLTLEERRKKLLTDIGEGIGLNTDKIVKGFNEVKSGISTFKDGLNKMNEAWGKVDQAVANYTKQIGGNLASMEKLKKTTIDFMETRSIGINYNTSMEELIKLQGDYNNSLGRSVSLTNDQKETFAAMKSVVGGEQTALEFTTKLETFGLNPDEVGDRVTQMFNKASKSGIAFEKYSKNFLNNIKLAQNYNFTNGLKGLDAMAKKATAIKLDMQQVANVAEKVSTLEGAMSTGAQLSVLGGSFAQMGNPLTMMYEGLNDMEGLQDRLVKMFGNLGKWDNQKGQIDISVFNKQRIKAASQEMGMDFSNVMEMINTNARRNIAEKQLSGRFNSGSEQDEEMRELILNKSQIDKNGQAFVTINDQKKNIKDITEEDRELLRSENNSDSENIREIAINTRGFKDISEGLEKQKEVGAAQINELHHIGETTKSVMNWTGNQKHIMRVLGGLDPAFKMINGTLMTINGLVNAILLSISIGKFSSGSKFKGINNATRHFGATNWGKLSTFGGNSTEWGRRSLRRISKAGGYGKYVARGAGLGAVAGAIGGIGDIITDNSELGINKGNHINGYTAAKAATSVLEWGGTGAAIGSIIPGIGTAVGAGLGAVAGGIYGGFKAHKEALLDSIARKGVILNNPDLYSPSELKIIESGRSAVDKNPYLRDKIISNNDYLPNSYAKGGYTGNGGILEPAGIVHKGEYVINSSEVDSIKNGDIKPIGNMMNQLQVSKNTTQANSNNNNGTMSFEPLKIDLSGKLDVATACGNREIDAKELMTPAVIDQIIKQIQIRTDYGLRKDKIHMKYS